MVAEIMVTSSAAVAIAGSSRERFGRRRSGGTGSTGVGVTGPGVDRRPRAGRAVTGRPADG